MSAFRIWGRVEQIGVRQFLAVASGVPEASGDRAIVLTAIEPDLPGANQAKDRMVLEVGRQVQERGGSVIDVETQ